ncbi:MAG: biotin synthase BioB [Muribaculaceae bacterium]|nr:biotin synthase BioB [Muribaculaceae bacterium]
MKKVEEALKQVMEGITLDEETLYSLSEIDSTEGKQALYEAAEQITRKFCPKKFDSCSIVNARSGRCSENCKWCAQSAHFDTGCHTYELIDAEEVRRAAHDSAVNGVNRFSLVASGRAVRGKALAQMCSLLKEVKETENISTCASLGLLTEAELQQLWDSGVHRYHCNLEAAPSYFDKLCTTHTHADKLATIAAAKRIGFEVCSGGIIGMGETRRQRVELAIALRQVEPASIPVNILCPIPGTPLENTPLLSDEEFLITVAIFRFAHPAVQIRFAGGRARLSHETQVKALRIGVNGGVVGDLLTTVGSTIAEDREMTQEAGYDF